MRAAPLLLSLLVTAAALGQSPYDAAKLTMQTRIDAERKSAVGNPDKKVWDFVIADKKAKTVTLLACGTTIQPSDPVEYFVNPLASGKDYESLAVTFAKPTDVRAALDFIGLQPGQPIDPDKDRYWPRGPRVVMTFTIAGKPVRAESLVLDTNTKKPLPSAGLVYTGSYTYTDAQGVTHVAADESDARPLAPTYNDPAALFDVPAQAPQSAVYGFQKPSPAWTVKVGEAVDITIALGTGSDAIEERYARIRMVSFEKKTHYGFDLWPFRESFDAPIRSVPSGTYPTASPEDLPHLMAVIAGYANGSRDLFITVQVLGDVPIREVRQLYAVLEAVEKDRGVKLDPSDPPSSGDLFHRAFFPDPKWRDRATRLGEPWELFLTRGPDHKLTAKLERSIDNPDRNAADTKIVESSIPADPAALAAHVNAHQSRWSKAIFVYPPADLTYGELMEWVRPVLATYPRVFVFPADVPTTRPAG